MAKLLKNINLAERLLPTINAIIEPVNQGQTIPTAFNPTYEQGGLSPKPFNPEIVQGSIILQNLIAPVEQGESVLKIQPPTKEPITALLKTNIVLANQVVPEEYKIINQLSALSRQTSVVNINFTDQLSLEDRIKQSNLGTTVSLPSFFLSDVHTDFIKVIPFDPVIVQGETTPLPFAFAPTQGSTTPLSFAFAPIQGETTQLPFTYLPAQGIVIQNSSEQSFVQIPNFTFQPQLGGTTPLLPIQDISGLQGIIIQNNQQQSFIQITNFTFQPVQGETVPNVIIITPPKEGLDPVEFNPVINQGGNVPIKFAASLIENQAADKGYEYISGFFLGAPPLLFKTQGKTPEILLYEVDRAASRLTPLLKHGGAVLPPVDAAAEIGGNNPAYPLETGTNLPNQGLGPITANPQAASANYSTAKGQLKKIDDSVDAYATYKNQLQFNVDGTTAVIENTLTPVRLLSTPDPIAAFTYQGVTNFIADRLNRRNSNQASGVDGAGNEYNIEASGIRSYEQLAQVAKDPTDQEANPMYKLQLEAEARYGITNENGDVLNSSVGATSDDTVILKFQSIRDGITLQFRSFIKSFNESFNASYEDVAYIGRPDKLKLYTGNSRGGSLGFMVIAMSEGEMQIMHSKLDRLAQIVYSAKYGDNGLYFEAPFINLTVGDYYKNMPVNINSLKYEMNPTEYPWETNYNKNIFKKQGPMMFDVSLEFNVIGKTIPVYGQRLIDTA